MEDRPAVPWAKWSLKLFCEKLHTSKDATHKLMLRGWTPGGLKIGPKDENGVDLAKDLKGILSKSKTPVKEDTDFDFSAKTTAVRARYKLNERISKENKLYLPFVETIRSKFDSLDKSGDGHLDKEEFLELVKWLNMGQKASPDDAQFRRMWQDFDSLNSGDDAISFEEFIRWFLMKFPHIREMSTRQLQKFMSDAAQQRRVKKEGGK